MKRKLRKIVRMIDRELQKELTCLQGFILGLIFAVMFILALFV